MATVKQCDRCKNVFNYPDMHSSFLKDKLRRVHIELCPKCSNLFLNDFVGYKEK